MTSSLSQRECQTWQECREAALAAAERGDYERFHDLAWRAVQKGPKNDIALMTMVARAQSLSGRPHDALVMLQRLAAQGVVTEAAEHEDFSRVRALPAWPALAARLSELAATPTPEPAPAAASKTDVSRKTPPSAAIPASPSGSSKSEAPRATAERAGAGAAPADGEAVDAIRFPAEPFTPAGLAYDAVSNRFIVADRGERKLMVIGERSQRMSNLIGAESGGFGEIGGIAIDVR